MVSPTTWARLGKTYSLVVKPITIRLILSLALSSGWPIHQIDIQNAFLHGTLTGVVYMTQPPGFIHPQYQSHICKLHKALYGLKQAPWAWFSWLSSKLIQLGFIISRSDTFLFIYHTSDYLMLVLIYVDDIIITCFSQAAIRSLL